MKRSSVAIALLALLTVPSLASAQPTSPPAAQPVPAPVSGNAALPAAEELFEKYIQAIGGLDAIHRHTAIKYVGTVKAPAMNYSAFLTIWQVAPRSLVMYIEPPGIPRSYQYCNGTLSWGFDPPPMGTGWRFFEGEQHEDMLYSADFYSDADYKNRYEKIATHEKTDFNGHTAYKVLARAPSGKEQFIFFDAETGLILGLHSVQIEDGKQIPLIIINDEYKEVDGVKYIGGQTHRTPGRDIVFTYRVIEPNPKDIPPIEIPAELKDQVPPPGLAPAPAPSPVTDPAPEAGSAPK